MPFKIKALTDNILKKGKGLLLAPRPGVQKAQAQGRGSDCISPGRPSPAFPARPAGREEQEEAGRHLVTEPQQAPAAAGHSKEHFWGWGGENTVIILSQSPILKSLTYFE